jgi:hypothetical protein
VLTSNLVLTVNDQIKAWIVFAACLACSAVGVAISLWVFGSTITGVKLWGLGLVISVVMLGLSYGAKYANEDARLAFTPIDLIQYLSQGFFWPSTWPVLADLLQIQQLQPPVTSMFVIETLEQLRVGLG